MHRQPFRSRRSVPPCPETPAPGLGRLAGTQIPHSGGRGSIPTRVAAEPAQHRRYGPTRLSLRAGRLLMMLSQNGGLVPCPCRALRYEITSAPIAVYTCHYTDCQRLTGSAFLMAVIVATEAFRLTDPEPHPLRRTTDSGRTVTRWVCAECGAHISAKAPNGIRAARGLSQRAVPERWMTHPGYSQPFISGLAVSSHWSCCLQRDKGSKHSPRTICSS
jgi:hypothetical protein